MASTSIWRASAPASSWPELGNDVLTADVAVVGGGITGVTLALKLAAAGRSVILVEADEIGGGTTGHSTGNLYLTVAGGLHELARKWNGDVVQVVESRRHALTAVERRVRELDVDCGWRRCPLYRYATTPGRDEFIENELRACTSAGLEARLEAALPAGHPQPCGPVLVLDGQAQMQPWAYVRQLARHAAAKGCRIFERSPVRRLDRDRKALITDHGEISAHDIVLATHSPIGFHLVQAEMLPWQEYGVAFEAAEPSLPPGIFWDSGDERLSVRGAETEGAHFVVCVGQMQKTGQHDTSGAVERLEQAARKHFSLGPTRFRWSAQSFQAADGLPYIGRDLSGAFVATGFATDGLVYGSLAADIIADDILGRDNPWAALYRPGRFEPAKAAKGIVEENVGVVKELVRGIVRRKLPELDGIRPGDGQVVRMNGDALAVHRDEAGALHAVSAVCTHLRCKVRWNAFEKSWDCPCHGSRFAPDGQVVCGPAIEPLQPVQLNFVDTEA
jgi:glycine/D-amino acid oxidase-like deaminating enzyme/nitrite reductase/ring-hydroxylating ferredoxin subunit